VRRTRPRPTRRRRWRRCRARRTRWPGLRCKASGVGAKLTTTETLPAEAVGAYRRVALRVTVDAATTWPVLVRLLQAIERATPRMFVDDLQIRAQPAPETLKEPPLDISFIVLAFRGAASGDAAPSPGAPPPPGAAP